VLGELLVSRFLFWFGVSEVGVFKMLIGAGCGRYDMSFDGGFWATHSFVRDVVASMATTVEYPDLVVGDDDGEVTKLQASGWENEQR
jgi:hypothetical protein